MSIVYKIQKSTDSEGRYYNTIGYWKADSILQVAEKLAMIGEKIDKNNLMYITVKPVNVEDISNILVKYVESAEIEKHNTLDIKLKSELADDLHRENLVRQATSKLTEEELMALLLSV